MECSKFILNDKELEGFKVPFDIMDYKDVWKDAIPKRVEEIINWDKEPKDCIWKRVVPDVITERYKQQEITRILKTGVWIFIKNMPVWLPPSYYFFLQYFRMPNGYPEFRLKRLKHVYEKLRVRDDGRYIGMVTMKNRADGETTVSMCDILWEVAKGNMDFGTIGIQSKTRKTVIDSCWRVFLLGWNSTPKWIKDSLYPDFASGDNTATKLKFISKATKDSDGRDIEITYAASGHNSFDSMHNMRRCVLDEFAKWEEGEGFYATYLNYEKFISPGLSRRGVFDILSSPADTAGDHNDDAMKFWDLCDPEELDIVDDGLKHYYEGVTKTRVRRYYSNPLEGIEEHYDCYGDADADKIYEHIMKRRKNVPSDERMKEVRAYPLNRDEMFGSTDQATLWRNQDGIMARRTLLQGIRFKDTGVQEPIKVYGNLEWIELDRDVGFRLADVSDFDVIKARFCFSYLPQNKEQLRYSNGRPVPPSVVERCIGIDPIDKDLKFVIGTRLSDAAMVGHKFLDIYQTGISRCPEFIYSNRPEHAATFYEDAIRAAVFTRSLVQVENLNSNIIKYFYDRGYIDWMLAKTGEPQNSFLKGDAPSAGKNGFLGEMIELLQGITNTPFSPDEKYNLEQVWFVDLLDDLLKFNPKETHKNDLTMAWGQALMGARKIMSKKVRIKSHEMAGVLSELFG